MGWLQSAPKPLPCHSSSTGGMSRMLLGLLWDGWSLGDYCQLLWAGALNRPPPGPFQSSFGVWHVLPSSRAVWGAAQQTSLFFLFQKQLKACSHSYRLLGRESHGCLNPNSSCPGLAAAMPQRWQRRWVQHGQRRGASLEILGDCNPNPNILERLLKGPVYRLAKHTAFAKQRNSPSPDGCSPRLDKLKTQPSLKQTVKPSHFLLFYSGKWI